MLNNNKQKQEHKLRYNSKLTVHGYNNSHTLQQQSLLFTLLKSTPLPPPPSGTFFLSGTRLTFTKHFHTTSEFVISITLAFVFHQSHVVSGPHSIQCLNYRLCLPILSVQVLFPYILCICYGDDEK